MPNPKAATAWLMLDVPPSKKRQFRQRWIEEVLPLAGTEAGLDRATEIFLAERAELKP